MENELEKQSSAEGTTTDRPESELAGILRTEEDPEVVVARLEKVAELAPRWKQAMRTILMTFTFPEDWETFGEGDKAKVCLSSAGAERVSQQFAIKFHEVECQKECWDDQYGNAVRFVYEGKASLGGKIIFAQGNYSTRDEFLGKASGEWKATSDINLGSIRTAAYHRFLGNAIKALLGLRALPVSEYDALMAGTGQNAAKTGGHTYGKGTKGGTSADDVGKQAELAELCLEIANAGLQLVLTEKDGKVIMLDVEADEPRNSAEIADNNCKVASGFMGDERDKSGNATGKKKWVVGRSANDLAGKWLDRTLLKVKDFVEKMNGGANGTND